MNDFAWEAPALLWLLAAIPAALALAVWAERQRVRSLQVLANAGLHPHLTAELDLRTRWWKTALILAAWVFAVLALARPAWDAAKPEPAKRRDIVVLLDVSRSMLAEDLGPNRLDVARRAVAELAERLKGDRIGLVAFAGSASLRCPLTTDYDFFRVALDGASPESVGMGGTEIAVAIRTAIHQGFDDLSRGSKHILLITDAEDHGREAAGAAAEAARAGIRLSAVGLGDEANGARVPLPEPQRYVTYHGREVWSKLNAPAIHYIAQAGGGGALVAGTGGQGDLGAGLASLVSGSQRKPAHPRTEAFWIPLALAIACLTGELTLSERRRA